MDSVQKMVYRVVNEMYEASSARDHLALTQACILLTYWDASYQPSAHQPSTGIMRAFLHAQVGGFDGTTCKVLTDRSRLSGLVG